VILALQHEHMSFWWIALGMGFVVVLAVIVLLSLLVSFVNDIDDNLADAWETATRVASNTATTWMLGQTAVATRSLADETKRHVELLGAKGNGR